MSFEFTSKDGKTARFDSGEDLFNYHERIKLRTPKKKKRSSKKAKAPISTDLNKKVSEVAKAKNN